VPLLSLEKKELGFEERNYITYWFVELPLLSLEKKELGFEERNYNCLELQEG